MEISGLANSYIDLSLHMPRLAGKEEVTIFAQRISRATNEAHRYDTWIMSRRLTNLM